MYVVLGATGTTGGSVARALLSAGAPVRVVGREAETLRPWAELGAEARVADLRDADSIRRAMGGARGAYVMTPPPGETGAYRSFQRRAGRAVAESLRAAGVERVVNLSSLGAEHPSDTGPVVGLHEQERHLSELDADVLHLRAAWFMENARHAAGSIRDGGTLISPVRGDLALPMISAREIGPVAAERLLVHELDGAPSPEATGTRDVVGPEEVTLPELAAALSEALGRPVRHVRPSLEEWEAAARERGVPAESAALYAEMFGAFNEGRIAPTDESPIRTSTTIAEFAERFARDLAS